MKKIKLLIIFSLLLFVTGCDVVYNLEFDGETFFETISFDVPKTTLQGESIMDYGNRWVCNNISCKDNIFISYSKKTKEFEDYENIKGTALYATNGVENSIAVSTCFYNGRIFDNEDSYKLSASNATRCFERYEELNSVTINFKSLYPVIDNNADTYENNNYQWVINRENAEEAEIVLEIAKDKDYNIKQYLVYIFIAIGIISLFGSLYIVYQVYKARK